MNKKQTLAFAMFAAVFGVAASPIISADNAFALRIDQPKITIQGDLTAPSGDKPFGGEKVVGEFYVGVYDDKTRIHATFNSLPSPGTVYEGWLVDVDSGEKTSIGIFQGNTQRHTSSLLITVENNFDNDLIVITEEPRLDTDPAPHTPVGGAVLGLI